MASNIKEQYPDQFYMIVDGDVPEPRPCKGWCEPWAMTDKTKIPDKRHLVPVSQALWNERLKDTNGFEFHDGSIRRRCIENFLPTLQDRAKAKLHAAQDYVMREFLSIGERPTAEWIDYQKGLRAIISGDDPSITDLPQEPVS